MMMPPNPMRRLNTAESQTPPIRGVCGFVVGKIMSGGTIWRRGVPDLIEDLLWVEGVAGYRVR
jgi:hypothetical protein